MGALPEPLTWTRAQRLAPQVCKREKFIYGAGSAFRAVKFKQIALDRLDVDWESRSKHLDEESKEELRRAKELLRREEEVEGDAEGLGSAELALVPLPGAGDLADLR